MARLTEQSYMAFPLRIGADGAAVSDRTRHVREQIEQVLFTAPGERVNRPDFGCGLLRELFGAGGEEERIATQFLVQQALITWLGELIEPRRVELIHRDERLIVLVEYVDRATNQPHAVTYEVSAL